jgi:hypothetical protein
VEVIDLASKKREIRINSVLGGFFAL